MTRINQPADRDPTTARTLSWGRCFVYVLPCAFEDQLKLGFSRDPLGRVQAFHHRYFEVFDLDRGFLLETDTVREARALELALKRSITLHNAPAPLTVRRQAAGHSEWYRGAYAQLAEAGQAMHAKGFALHDPLRAWMHDALLARRDQLYSWTRATLSPQELDLPCVVTPGQTIVRDALDAYAAFGIDLSQWLPDDVALWHRAVSAR